MFLSLSLLIASEYELQIIKVHKMCHLVKESYIFHEEYNQNKLLLNSGSVNNLPNDYFNEYYIHDETIPSECYAEINNANNDRAYVIRIQNNIIIISARGSANDYDWETNRKRKQVDYKLGDSQFIGRVHEGFLKRMRESQDNLEKVLDHFMQTYSNINKVVFNGRSMGGALAQLMALECKYKNPSSNVEVITIGSPRLFDKEAGEFFSNLIGVSNIYRCTLEKFAVSIDSVTHVPPNVFDFHHAKSIVYKIPCGNVSINPNHYNVLLSYIDALRRYIKNESLVE